MSTTAHHTTPRRLILDFFAAPFRPRPRRFDQNALSDHFKRDIGLLDGHAPYGSIR
ncbi:hypothetical protein [Mesorhizobium sp. INR15]|uniref:hypothetical protein n=1 Tax=Mesorhizobium sp. INR15 TaxID=2654248 RepID=UPI00189670BE|nr:hypothetical protein [Mesorhizobium sp. INR15]